MKKIISNIIYIICIVLFFISTSTHAKVQLLDKIIAQVDQDIISLSQLNERINILSKQTDQKFNRPLKQEALEQLILESIQLQMAKRAGMNIDDEIIDGTIKNMRQQEKLNPAQFNKLLKKRGMTVDTLKETLRREMLISHVQRAQLQKEAIVSEQEIENYITSHGIKNFSFEQYRILKFSLKQKSTTNDRAFMSHLRNSLEKGEISLQSVVKKQKFDDVPLRASDMGWVRDKDLSPQFLASIKKQKSRSFSAPITDKQGTHLLLLIDKQGQRKIYVDQVNARHILIAVNKIRDEQAAKKLAQSLRQKLLAGDDFAQLAKLFSDDKGSASEGGNLGWSDPRKFVPEFRDTVTSLRKNQLSDTIQTSFGWHIIQLLGKRKHDASQEIIRNNVKQKLQQQKLNAALKDWHKKIRKEAFVKIKI